MHKFSAEYARPYLQQHGTCGILSIALYQDVTHKSKIDDHFTLGVTRGMLNTDTEAALSNYASAMIQVKGGLHGPCCSLSSQIIPVHLIYGATNATN